MKIGIYDKWLREFGGGERVALTMAEALSKKGHKVDLISYSEIDKNFLERKMDVDLSKVNIVTWFERRAEKLTPKTSKYDLFINVSYLDHLPSEAKASIYYIHFPTPIRRSILGLIKYETVLPFLRKFLIIPEVSQGLVPIEEIFIRGGWWLQAENKIVFDNCPKQFILTLRIYGERFKVSLLDLINFSSPNSKIEVIDKYIEHQSSVLFYKLKVQTVKNENPIIEIIPDNFALKNSLALVSMTVYDFRYFLFNAIKRFLPSYEMALYGSSSYKPAAGLDTYDTFLANSNFTKIWTKKYWSKEAKVLYPPVDAKKFKPAKKKNIILNVGRFFVGGHSKKQDVLVKAFKEMVDQKMLDKNWELHLVGGVASGSAHEIFVRDLKKEALDYPIFFHHLANFKDLKKLYSEAKIYWHATGFGENISQNPIRFEHFGITVVEAMAEGVVPVVFRGGGVIETVSPECGFFWNSVQQLKKATQKLSQDKKLCSVLSKAARKKSQLFSRKRFVKEFLNSVQTLVI